jgi:hypothetical protein
MSHYFSTLELPKPQEDWDYAESEITDYHSQHKFLEVIYVGDHLITQQIGLIELPEMLLIIGNVVRHKTQVRYSVDKETLHEDDGVGREGAWEN